jgi:hypothetical protein
VPRKPQELIKKSPFYPYAYRLKKVVDASRRRFDYIRAEIESKLQPRSNSHPLKLYAIDPNDIEVALQKEALNNFTWRLSPALDGEWDTKVEGINNYDLIYSLKNHFNEGLEWKETDLYSRAISCIDGSKRWIGRPNLSDRRDLRQYLKRIDGLYRKIKSEGYRTQRELAREENQYFWVSDSAYETHEITVHLGRNGELIFEDGWHRFAIARALGLERIPVRVAARHRDGQSKLEKLPKY